MNAPPPLTLTRTYSLLDMPTPPQLILFTPLLLFHRKQLGQQETMTAGGRMVVENRAVITIPWVVTSHRAFRKLGRTQKEPTGSLVHTS
jgi:hypothetical protein